MERYLGIDVHRDSCTAVVLSAGGKKTDQRVVATESAALLQYVKSLSGELHVSIDEGEWSEWLVELLRPRVARVVSSQPQARPSQRCGGCSRARRALADGSDRYAGLQGPSRVVPAARSRAPGVEANQERGARTKQQLKSLYRRRGVACTGGEVYSKRHRERWIEKLPASVRPSAVILSAELEALRELQHTAELQMLAAARKFPMWHKLKTAPGIGRKRAALLLAIVVTPHRFRNKRRFWSYCGLAVVTRSSADWVQQANGKMSWGPVIQTRGLNKACNRQLKDLFKGAALTAKRSGPMKDAYERLVAAGTKPNLARLTIARKIAAIVLAMWKTDSEYQIMS